MNRFIKRGLLSVLAILLTVAVYLFIKLQDRHPDYWVDLNIRPTHQPAYLQAGFAKRSISPEYVEPWTDVDGNAQYEPEKGDTYEDLNGNGVFDTYWIAGFSQKRAAASQHDTLWARVMAINDGQTTLVIASLDAIGFSQDEIVDIRLRVNEQVPVDYISIASTHTHESPDLLGLWGESPFTSGVSAEYMERVKTQTSAAIVAAYQALEPAIFRVAQDLEGAVPLVGDTRDPQVLDPGIRMLHAQSIDRGSPLGTLLSWANHPETLWSKNLSISSDFPHYFREYMEKGIYLGDSLVHPGSGGIAVYVNGAIGGLMTTHAKDTLFDPARDTLFVQPSFEKAASQGRQLAQLSLAALDSAELLPPSPIRLRAQSIHLPLANPLFRLAAILGVIDRGMSGWMKVRSEVAYWELGPVSCIQVPGEIYPEIINGGVEAPEGQDFVMAPSETPPLRELMRGKYRWVLGLTNDMVGYIIPKSEWDEKAPYLYGEKDSPYGEINSMGPETAPIIYQSLTKLIRESQD